MRTLILSILMFALSTQDTRAQPGAEVASPELRRAESARFVDAWLGRNLRGLVLLYEQLHTQPELSLHEEETAGLVALELRRAGYAVTPEIGGHGVVGIMKNGEGPTLLIRGDMDALPVTEATGLPYASTVRATLDDGTEVGVMHACGHDVHTTNLLGTARLMALAREQWSGTLIVLGQPAEELGRGALNMIGDALFGEIPKPDFTLALHVESELPAGSVGYTEGWAFANVDAVDVTIFGRGGHGARPHMAADPIVASAHFITALQTLVSRRIDPQRPAVVTVGSIHGGTKHNVIPDDVHMQLTVRSYSDDVRAALLEGIAQIAEDTCRTFECPRTPEVSIRKEYTPAVFNDPAMVARALEVFREQFGDDHVVARLPSMGGEDFGRFARTFEVPGLLFRLGAVDPARYAESQQPGGSSLPSLHSSMFAPLPELTLDTGIRAMTLLAIDLLQPTVREAPASTLSSAPAQTPAQTPAPAPAPAPAHAPAGVD